LSVRSIILYAIAALVLTIPMAAVSSLLHSGSEPATLLPDPRTIGQRAVDDAQARLRRTPDDAHLMTQLASAYLQRARESGDPSYYTKADGLLAAAEAELPADADLAIAEASLALSRPDFATALDWGTRAAPLGGDPLVRRPGRQPLFCAGRPRPRGARVPSFARARRRLRARERRPRACASGARRSCRCGDAL